MAVLILKLIVCPLTVLIASVIFPNVNYNTLFEPIIVGIILALSTYLMEMFFLKRGTLWFSTIMDFIALTLIVYYFSIFQGASVTFFGANGGSSHQRLIRSGRTHS